MNALPFNLPVHVGDVDNVEWEISTIHDALTFLERWPQERRGPIYQTALRACRASKEAQLPCGDGRLAFIGFARSAGIFRSTTIPISVAPAPLKPRENFPT